MACAGITCSLYFSHCRFKWRIPHVFAGIHRAAGLMISLGLDRDNLFVTLSARTLAFNLRIIARVANAPNEGRRAGASTTVTLQSTGGTQLAHEFVRPRLMALFQNMLSATDGARSYEVMIRGDGDLRVQGRVEARLREDCGQSVVGIRPIRGKPYAPSQDEILEPGNLMNSVRCCASSRKVMNQ